jgi:hypothetical protein
VPEITEGLSSRQDSSQIMVNEVAKTATDAKVMVVVKSHRAMFGDVQQQKGEETRGAGLRISL